MNFLNKLFGGGREAPGLPQLDIGGSARKFVDAMSDDYLQQRMLGVRERYDPQYQDLQLGLARRAMDPLADLTEDSARRAQRFGNEMATRQADLDASLLRDYGGRFTEAYRASDPLMQARVQQANQMADQAYQAAQRTDLSPEQRRRATQSAREGLVARGRGMDNAGIAAEAMSREDVLRRMLQEDRREAQGLGTYAANLNRATSVDPMAMFRRGGEYTRRGIGERSAMFGIPQEQVTRINPDAGVNIGMQELANRANYQASTYGAREAGAAGAASGFMNMLGSIGQGWLAGRSSAPAPDTSQMIDPYYT